MIANITQDKFWGFVLIALGVIAITWKPFDKINAHLQGTADRTLTLALFVLAGIVIMIALSDKPSLKALAIFWVVTP